MLNLKRTFEYDKNGDAVLVIKKDKPLYPHIFQLGPKEPGVAYKIFHDDAWKYSSEHNELYEDNMAVEIPMLIEAFELGDPTVQKISQVKMYIEDSLELLLEVKPQIDLEKIVGEITMSSNPVGEDGTESFTNDLSVPQPIPYKETYSEY